MKYEPDEDEKHDAWESKRRRNQGCKCGYPDMPGQCPGPANCPMAGEDARRRAGGQMTFGDFWLLTHLVVIAILLLQRDNV